MAVEGLSFGEALQKLADKAGIRLPVATAADEKAESQRSQLIDFGVFASAHFKRNLTDPMRGSVARKYVEKRALREATITRFGLGFAQDSPVNLLEAAKEKGYADATLEASGLFKRSERGSLYDFFRNRVMFPIKDISGNVVAFGGRDLGDSPAKYINSPETRLYKKSRVLYGLHEARDAIRKTGYAVLVEGYFDLLRCLDVGVENVVATCGTALTEEQAALIRRYAPEVVLVYDGDAAGIRAALKGTKMLVAAGLAVRAAALPGGLDPDDFVRTAGADAFRTVLAEAKDFVGFYVAMSEERTQTIEGRTAVAHELFEIVRGITDEILADGYLKQIGKALGLSEWACKSEYEKLGRGEARSKAKQDDEPGRPLPLARDDVDFVSALISDEALLRMAEQALDEVPLPLTPLASLLELLFTSDQLPVVSDIDDPEAQRLWCAASAAEPRSAEEAKAMVSKRVARLRRESLVMEQVRMQEAIREAERDNPALLGELLGELVRIGRSIEQLEPV
jgi:DNA primase